MTGMRVLLCLVCLALASPLAAQSRTDKPVITMGVRVDAKPFAWYDRSNDSFLGFLVDICTDAVTRAGYPFTQVAIDAATRAAFLKGEGPKIDLLCDPTTITLHRIQRFIDLGNDGNTPERFAFSPIVFVANGTFVTAKNDDYGILTEPADPALCHGHPAPEPAAEENGDPAPPVHFAAGFVTGTTVDEVLKDIVARNLLNLGENQFACPVPQPSHSEGIAAFCRGDLRYYFGDLDIVNAYVREQATLNHEPCEFDVSSVATSYEPYAFVVTSKTPGFRPDFNKAIYEVFYHGTAIDRFKGHFEGMDMSAFLETLFRINQIPEGSPQTDP